MLKRTTKNSASYLVLIERIRFVFDEYGHVIETCESRHERQRVVFANQIFGYVEEDSLLNDFGSAQVERVVEELSSMYGMDGIVVLVELVDEQ